MATNNTECFLKNLTELEEMAEKPHRFKLIMVINNRDYPTDLPFILRKPVQLVLSHIQQKQIKYQIV